MIRKNLYILVDDLGIGGAQKQLYSLITRLTEFNITVITRHLLIADQFSDKENIKQIVLPFSSVTYVNDLAIILKLFLDRPAILVGWLETPSLMVGISSIFMRGANTVQVIRNGNTQFDSLKRLTLRMLMRCVDKVVVNSDNLYKNLSKSNHNVIHIKNFLESGLVDRRKEFNTEHKILLICASYLRNKNILRFIEACSLCANELKSNRILVKWLGPIHDEGLFIEAQRLIKLYGLSDLFILRGESERISEEISKAWAGALPSISEGTPNFALEMAIHKIPFICSDIPALTDVFGRKEDMLFDPLSVREIAKALSWLIGLEESACRSMCDNLDKIVRSQFNNESILAQWKTCLN